LFGYIEEASLTDIKIRDCDITTTGQFGGVLSGYSVTSVIQDCSSSGTLIIGGNVGGGLLGLFDGTVIRGYSECSVSTTSGTGEKIGGLIGNFKGSMSNCYAVGTVTGFQYVAGLCGGIANTDATFVNCHATGTVTATQNSGGLAAVDTEGGTTTATNCFWDTQTTGEATSVVGTGKTTAQMKTQSTFTDWNFIVLWDIDATETINAGYPYLDLRLSPRAGDRGLGRY